MKTMKEIYETPAQWESAMSNGARSTIESVCNGDLYAREIAAGQRPYRARFSIKAMEELANDENERE
jgi:hypothetical protein